MAKPGLPPFLVLLPSPCEALGLGPHPRRTLHWLVPDLLGRGIPPSTPIVGGGVLAGLEERGRFDEPLVLGPIGRRRGGLGGLRVLVTRSREEAAGFCAGILRAGGIPVEYPAMEKRETASWSAVDREIRRLGEYDWIAFTSREAVGIFVRRMLKLRRDVRRLPRIASVGEGTSRGLAEFGLRANLVPRKFTAEELGRRLNGRVLHPTSDPHSPDLAREAGRRGAEVVEPVVYRIGRPARPGPVPRYDVAAFGSSQTVRNFVEMARPARGTPAACIGPVTARTARRLGLKVVAEPKRSTFPDLIRAIAAWRRRSR